MWIRSQHKYSLIKTDTIRICEDNRDDCGDYLICGYSDGYDHELGLYSTFEKALLVLNYMQSEIQNNVCDEQTVFEMPTDDEV